ncbi:MAG TPA: metallophosphoesterase, partial [Candidatus Binataceae bacterium]|nr:metallophosphoesterase [Candidatus Binataceae bacterium]
MGAAISKSGSSKTHARKRKPPLALRPIHRMWRRTIDEMEIANIALPVRALPEALAGVVACQISDFHLDMDEDVERLELAVDAINREKPEFVFLTGDYFSGPDTMRRYVGGFRHALARLHPKVGVYAVAGNHDHWSSFDTIAAALEAAGVDL